MPHRTNDTKKLKNNRRRFIEATMQEMKLGRLIVSFFPKGTIVIRLGEGEDMTMFSAPDAERLVAFLQQYLDSYKK